MYVISSGFGSRPGGLWPDHPGPDRVSHRGRVPELRDAASERGRYRVMVRRYPSTPEHHAAFLAPGDVVAFSGGPDMPYALIGGYRLAVAAISRAPERHAASIAIGDTMSDESIDPAADVDEFTFSGTAGQRPVALFDIPQAVVPPGFRFEVIAPGSGALLGAIEHYNPTANFSDLRAAFTLPTTGTYLVRVRGLDAYATSGGLYRFATLSQ